MHALPHGLACTLFHTADSHGGPISPCELDRHIGMLLWCYHHLVTLKLTPTDTSSCYHHVNSVCSTCTSPSNQGWHARSLTRWTQTVMTESRCEFNRYSTILHAAVSSLQMEFGTCLVSSWCCDGDARVMIVTNTIVTNICSPNEDFGRRNKRWNPDFRSTFQGCENTIWATNPWKVSRKSGFHLLFLLPKSSFGRDKIQLRENQPWSAYRTHTRASPMMI